MTAATANSSILDEIVFNKRQEVTLLKAQFDLPKACRTIAKMPAPRNFKKALLGKPALIAELKKHSPSAGVLAAKYAPAQLAKTYASAGAAALSVLTDQKYFQGNLVDLAKAKRAVSLPVMRKDFIVDSVQIYESRLAGADAVLLIVGILSARQLAEFINLAHSLKLQSLVEVHNKGEAERALAAGAEIIGINNRDLHSFKTDLRTTFNLLASCPQLKEKVIVSESGINSASQVKALQAAGVSAILVGESLLRSREKKKKLKELLSGGGKN